MARLGYDRWENFQNIINKAQKACEISGIKVIGQFRDVTKKIKIHHGGHRFVKDFRLTRYACYLIAQNGDSSKPAIAAAQTYFAIQTYRQEQLAEMTNEEKRLYIKSQVTAENLKLFDTAKQSGVFRFGTFYDRGYLGLYGLTAKEIKKKKAIGKDSILDRAGSLELAANLFRITQTQDQLQNELDDGVVLGDSMSGRMHNMVGGKVRKIIREIGGKMPEDLPAEENIKKLARRVNKESKLNTPKRNPRLKTSQ
jgi:DNA-damage-inducible protein D